MEPKALVGEYAWVTLILGVVAYDLAAIKTKKAETMSSAIWRNLEHPIKSIITMGAWSALTFHLFGNKNARKSIKTSYTIKRIRNELIG